MENFLLRVSIASVGCRSATGNVIYLEKTNRLYGQIVKQQRGMSTTRTACAYAELGMLNDSRPGYFSTELL